MVYLESFYSNMILKYKSAKIYTESLVENSQMNSGEVWSQGLAQTRRSYILAESLTFEQAE